MKARRKKRLCMIAVLSAVVLIMGILIHSAGFFLLNRLLPFPPEGDLDRAETRLFWRMLIEGICGSCIGLFIVGSIGGICYMVKKKIELPLRWQCLYLTATASAAIVCAGLFGILDKNGWGDYLFPVWSVMGAVVILFLVLIGIQVGRRKGRYEKNNGGNISNQ